jgi:hypothetical protein
LIPAGIALAQGPGKLRSDLKHDTELLALMPEGSDARNALIAHLGSQIERLTKFDVEAKREPAAAGLALVAAVGCGYATVWFAEKGTWWPYGAAALLAFIVLTCVYGKFESLQRIPRPPKEKKPT